jgi:hypothetical protein
MSKSDCAPGRLVFAFLGRFVSMLGTTLLGLILGLSYGASQAGSVIDGAGKVSMGLGDGLISIFVWVFNILIGGVAGTAIGLMIGVVGMMLVRRSRA